MEKCKFCGAELEEEVTLCPACGKDIAADETEQPPAEEAARETKAAEVTESAEETEAGEETKAKEECAEDFEKSAVTPKKIALSVVAIVLLLAIIAGLLTMGIKPSQEAPADTGAPAFQGTVPADGEAGTVTEKGSYSIADEEAANTASEIVATMGEHTLSNSQLQVYYWNYVQTYLNSENGYYAMMAGAVDFSQPLDMQPCAEDPTLTWQQFFLNGALENWKFMQALAIEAEAAGFVLSETDQAALDATPASLEDAAVQVGFANAEELIADRFGAGATVADYMHFETLYYHSIPYYYEASAALTVTDEEVEAFFTAHEQDYTALGLLRTDRLVDVRHILIMPEGATNENIRTETFPEEAWTASEKKAQDIVKEYQKGEQTEERFAELANTYTQDGNDSNMDGVPDGGLYTGITKSTGFVPEFLAWCMDENRQVGDVEIVKTQFGYHIMYFSKGEVLWPQYAEQDLLMEMSNRLITDAVDRNPSTVSYDKIKLTVASLG